MIQALKIIAVPELIITAVVKAMPAFAEPATAQNVSIVRTADLDLSREDGGSQLNAGS